VETGPSGSQVACPTPSRDQGRSYGNLIQGQTAKQEPFILRVVNSSLVSAIIFILNIPKVHVLRLGLHLSAAGRW
jgi:hypothetical protein